MMAANTPPTADLHPWQVWLGGLASLILTIGMARFAYTPMLPVMQMDAGLSIPGGGWLATANYVGYMAGALLVARIENPVWRHRLYGWGLWLAVIGTVGMASKLFMRVLQYRVLAVYVSIIGILPDITEIAPLDCQWHCLVAILRP